MLKMKPNCEICDTDLPADSTVAMICSYECTFCKNCVENILQHICPNCGGHFSPRPIRLEQEYRSGVSLIHQPASDERTHTLYNKKQIKEFIKIVQNKNKI